MACPIHPMQVVRGYVGDQQSKPVFDSPTPFDVLGTGYQRPFELATLRLFNMIGVLSKCEWCGGVGGVGSGGCQRPFELATLRLFNMIGVLSECQWCGGADLHFITEPAKTLSQRHYEKETAGVHVWASSLSPQRHYHKDIMKKKRRVCMCRFYISALSPRKQTFGCMA